jgi:RNA polymerase sigma-70 factor (ECF subfamily)
MTPDQELLEGCRKGNERAHHKLYQLSFPVLIKVCYRYARCKDDALDLLNRGFLKIVNNIKKYDTNLPFEVWIKKIMVNVIIDEFRKSKNYRSTLYLAEREELESSAFNTRGSENEGESRMMASEVMEHIQLLPPVTREVLNLNVIDGYSHREISGMLGISENASRWHLHSARTKLKKMLESSEKTSDHYRYANER